MKKLMEDLFQHIIPENEGYDYLFSDLVYVPIYETSLLVTKRTILPISLVEEKVLQLIDAGVYQIDEIAQILGLKRKLLDVTLADLYSKNLVMVSSDSCKIMIAGKTALNDLNRTEKKQDVLKNVCLDGILGNIIDPSLYELLNNIRDNDGKLNPVINVGEVKYYIKQFKMISQIFDEENVLYFSEGVQPLKEELLKIDKVENTFVKYIKIPIHIYVSSNGLDIDIVQVSNKYKELLELYKDYIIEQINNKKVLKKHFKSRRINQQGYKGNILEEKKYLFNELKRIHFTKDKKSVDYTYIAGQVLNDRKIMDGEYEVILKYIISKSANVDLYVDNLDDWAFNNVFTAMLTENMGKSNLSIYYAYSNNINAAKKQIDWNYKADYKCEKNDNKYYFCWKTDYYLLYGVPKLRKVIDDNTKCLHMTYYLKKI